MIRYAVCGLEYGPHVDSHWNTRAGWRCEHLLCGDRGGLALQKALMALSCISSALSLEMGVTVLGKHHGWVARFAAHRQFIMIDIAPKYGFFSGGCF